MNEFKKIEKVIDNKFVEVFYIDDKEVSEDTYYITPEKCTECVGFHEEPQCAAVCPVDCCIDDPEHEETEEQLLSKKSKMHM